MGGSSVTSSSRPHRSSIPAFSSHFLSYTLPALPHTPLLRRGAAHSYLYSSANTRSSSSVRRSSSRQSPSSPSLVIADHHHYSILAVVELNHSVDHVVVQAFGVISLACAIMTVSFSSILIAAFSAHLAELEARDGPNHTLTTDVEIAASQRDEQTPSAVNNLFHLSISKLTSGTLWSYSNRTPVPSRPLGGITMSSLLNLPSGWRGMFSSSISANVSRT